MPMKISKAIELLELRFASPFVRANPDTKDAIKLGIEALKEIKRARDNGYRFVAVRLPGEEPEE